MMRPEEEAEERVVSVQGDQWKCTSGAMMEEGDERVTLKVKVPSGDVSVSCLLSDTVSTLKDTLKSQLSAQGKHLRLIFSGKLLEEDERPLHKYGVKDGSFIHAVITSAPGPASSTPSSAPPASSSSSAAVRYRGFDRLTHLGLSIDETAALRSSFNSQVSDFIEESNREPREGEDSTAFRYRMEEEWMASQASNSEFSMNLPNDRSAARRQIRLGPVSASTFRFSGPLSSTLPERPNSGSVKDFFWGFAMGFGLGILMLFCIWDRNVSHKQKLGILTGVSLHLIGGLMQQNRNQLGNSSRINNSLMADAQTELSFDQN